MNTVYQFPYLWEALDTSEELSPASMEASKSRTPLTAVYQLGMMSLYSEAVYSAEWLNGIELELWEYFSQNIDPMLIDSSGREEYEGDQFRFYPQDEWVARVGQAWPIVSGDTA
jgi:hypothetical protein